MVLAAGLGTRLRPITYELPKPMVPVLDRPVMAHVVDLLARGRVVNLAAATGHPAEVMDMSFANQALSAEYLVRNAPELEPDVLPVPEDIEHEVARLKLDSLGVAIDELTPAQRRYLHSWERGT